MVIARHSTEVSYRGRTYRGVWYVEGGAVHVESPFGCRSADLEGAEARARILAQLLFRSMVRAGPAS